MEKAAEAETDLFRVAWQVLNKHRYPQDRRFTDLHLLCESSGFHPVFL